METAERKHAVLSASGASRWLNCTPSARLEEDARTTGSDDGSIYAQEGTLAHELSEAVLRHMTGEASHTEFEASQDFIYRCNAMPADMDVTVETLLDGSMPYIEYVIQQLSASQANGYGALLLEQRLDLTDYAPESFGTGDAIIISADSIEIIDLKYGKGVRVSAVDNPQLKLYGLGAVAALKGIFEFETVTMTIVQPRVDNIASVTMSVAELIEWGETVVKPTAEKAFAGLGECKTGSWCKWCRVFNRCAMMGATAEERVSRDPKLLTDDELVTIYKRADLINGWLDSVEAYIQGQARSGRKFEGLKLVEAKTMRKWYDEDVVKSVLTDSFGLGLSDICNTKLKGITDIEKKIGKKPFAEYLVPHLVKPKGAPTLVPSDDPRREIEINTAEHVFASAVEE